MSEIQGNSEVEEKNLSDTTENDPHEPSSPSVESLTKTRDPFSSESMKCPEKVTSPPDEPKDQSTTAKRGEVLPRSVATKPMSPFAKFRELDRQNSLPSLPSTPKTPSKEFSFKFTDPVVQNNAVQIKERLLSWCRAKTKEYENIQIDNFSTSWNNGLAFCALLHHFRPEAFDYNSLKPENRRKNFQLAFEKADEIADITPLLDVEDMVMMRKPDWKCVFTYVQSIYRRFKDED